MRQSRLLRLCARVDRHVIAHACMPRSIRGCFTATLSSIRAAPVGSRRPCSQSCRVRGETPNNSANSCCDMPMLARASAASVSFTFVTRAAWPRRICMTDCNKSFWNFSISEDIFNSLPQLSQERRGKSVELGLRIDNQQPNNFLGRQKVDYSSTTALADSGARPTYFPTTSTPPYHCTNLWVGCNEIDELLPLRYRPDFRCISDENRSLGNSTHGAIIRQCRSECNQVSRAARMRDNEAVNKLVLHAPIRGQTTRSIYQFEIELSYPQCAAISPVCVCDCAQGLPPLRSTASFALNPSSPTSRCCAPCSTGSTVY
jgi:hypothetical protein